MSMEPMDELAQPTQFSPEHVVGEHRVGLGLMGKRGEPKREHGVVLGLFDGPRDEPFLVCMRLLSAEQALELATYLVDTARHASKLNGTTEFVGLCDGCGAESDTLTIWPGSQWANCPRCRVAFERFLAANPNPTSTEHP